MQVPNPMSFLHLSYQVWMRRRSTILGAASDQKNNSKIGTGGIPLAGLSEIEITTVGLFF